VKAIAENSPQALKMAIGAPSPGKKQGDRRAFSPAARENHQNCPFAREKIIRIVPRWPKRFIIAGGVLLCFQQF